MITSWFIAKTETCYMMKIINDLKNNLNKNTLSHVELRGAVMHVSLRQSSAYKNSVPMARTAWLEWFLAVEYLLQWSHLLLKLRKASFLATQKVRLITGRYRASLCAQSFK